MTFLRTLVRYALPIAVFSLLLNVSVYGQPNNPPDPDDVPVPITGLEWLLLAGGAYGGAKLLRKAKKEDD